jgi:hypothetical protein
MRVERQKALPKHGHEIPDVRTFARARTDAVMKRLDQWLASADDRASLAAATILLDRGWGKVEGRADPTGPPVTVILAPIADDSESWRQQYGPSGLPGPG